MPHEVTILSINKIPVTDGPRRGQFDTAIGYMVKDGTGNLVLLPKPNPTDQEIKDAIKKDLEDRGALVGKTFTV